MRGDIILLYLRYLIIGKEATLKVKMFFTEDYNIDWSSQARDMLKDVRIMNQSEPRFAV